MKTIIFCCVIASLTFVLIGAQDRCQVESCPHYGSSEVEHVLTLLPVPWNCSLYVACDREVQILRPCPLGLHFNAALRVCDFPDRAGCEESCSEPAV